MHRPRKKYLVEYELHQFDWVLGYHVSIFNKWYYTKLGAKFDAFQLKRHSLKGSKYTLFEAAKP